MLQFRSLVYSAMKPKNISENAAILKNLMSRGDVLRGTRTCLARLISLVALGLFFYGCSNNIEFDYESKNVAGAGIGDFKSWLNSQAITNRIIDKEALNWDNAEIELMRDGKTPCVSFEIYKGKNSLGNDSLRRLQIASVEGGFIGTIMEFSFFNKEYARYAFYNLDGQILQEGQYSATRQLYMRLKIYPAARKWRSPTF